MRFILFAALLAGTSFADTFSPLWGQGIAFNALVLGHNTVWSRNGLGLWSEPEAAVSPAVVPLLRALRPRLLRFPGGTRAMRYRFDETIGPLANRKAQCDPFLGKVDASAYGLDEFLRVAETLGAEVSLVSAWVDGTPEQTAAMVAYVNGQPDSEIALGIDANGVDWKTAGYWARKRAEYGHPAPYRVRFLEVGNEQYLDEATGPAISCGRPSRFRQNERWVKGVAVPTTALDHAEQVAATFRLVKQIDSRLLVGASAYAKYDGKSDAADAVAPLDAKAMNPVPWNRALVERADFDFFVLHAYTPGIAGSSLAFPEKIRKVVRDLARLAPGKRAALTEYGSFLHADGVQGALLAAEVSQMALDEGLLMSARHLLIEDDRKGLFAPSAAILGPTLELTPGYHAMRFLSGAEGFHRIPLDASKSSSTKFSVFAAQSSDGNSLYVLVGDRRANSAAESIRVDLPEGNWEGQGERLSGPTLASSGSQVDLKSFTLHPQKILTLEVVPHSLTAVRLSLMR